MIGIGTGAIGLAGGAGNWVAREPVARNAHLYLSPETGRYARAGAPASFSQMGTFEAAGTRFEQQASGLLVPHGADVPRLADYSVGGERRWLMEGAETNETIAYWEPTDLTGVSVADQPGGSGVASIVDASAALDAAGLSELGNGRVYRVDNSAGTGTTTLRFIPGTFDSTGQFAARVYAKAVSGPAVTKLRTGYGDWVSQAITSNFTPVTIDDGTRISGTTNASDVLWVQVAAGSVVDVCFPQLVVGTRHVGSPIVVNGGAATRAPDLFTSDLSGFDLSGGVSAYIEGRINASDGASDRVIQLDLGGDNATRCVLVHNAVSNVLSAQMYTSAGGQQAIVNVAYTLGDDFKAAIKFSQDDFAFAFNGSEVGVHTSCDYTAPDAVYFAASNASGSVKPGSVSFAKAFLAPASFYTEALTA